MRLTKHSISRGYDRLSIDSLKLHEISCDALKYGSSRNDYRGKFKLYLDSKVNNMKYIRIYHSYIWIYSVDNDSLITFFKVPKQYIKRLKFYLKFTSLNKPNVENSL